MPAGYLDPSADPQPHVSLVTFHSSTAGLGVDLKELDIFLSKLCSRQMAYFLKFPQYKHKSLKVLPPATSTSPGLNGDHHMTKRPCRTQSTGH